MSNCDNCHARCCSFEGGYVKLTDAENALFGPFEDKCMPKEKGWCVKFNHDTKKCSVYDTRPAICKRFSAEKCTLRKYDELARV